jgi:hypothetical protein
VEKLLQTKKRNNNERTLTVQRTQKTFNCRGYAFLCRHTTITLHVNPVQDELYLLTYSRIYSIIVSTFFRTGHASLYFGLGLDEYLFGF